MPHLSPTTSRLDEDDVDFDPKSDMNWQTHQSRNVDKAKKRRSSINRQLGQGAPIEEVRSKILALHRQSTAYNGNGSYDELSLQLGLEPRPNEKIPKSRLIDDSEERMIQRVDDLLDETTEAYHFYTADEVRPPIQQKVG